MEVAFYVCVYLAIGLVLYIIVTTVKLSDEGQNRKVQKFVKNSVFLMILTTLVWPYLIAVAFIRQLKGNLHE